MSKNILNRYEQAKVDTLIAESGWHFWLGAKYDQENEVPFTIRSGRGLVICLTFECRRSNGTVERIGVIQIGLKESQVLLLHKNPKKKGNFDLILQI